MLLRRMVELGVWIRRALSLRRIFRRAEHLGDAWIMVRKARPGKAAPSQLGCWAQSLTVFSGRCRSSLQRARAAGAKIVEELNETPYGEFQYGVEDLDDHHWLFARHGHARDVSPEDWGAKLAD